MSSKGHGNQERWLLTYADLITLLLAFFVMMYSISSADLEKFRQLSVWMRHVFSSGTEPLPVEQNPSRGALSDYGGGAISEDFAFISAEVNALAEELGLGDKVEVRLRPEGIAISIADNAAFASGRAELGELAYPLLGRISELVAPLSNEIRIEGHTDDLPSTSAGYETNWDLSAARAVTVLKYMVQQGGLDPYRLTATACSQYRPVAANDQPEGRSKNRRAEILIIYPEQP